MTTWPIAVGTDGTPPSDAAVRWAAAEAAARGVPLRVVYVYEQPDDPAEQLLAGAVLDAAAAQARGAAPTAEIWAEALCGDPAQVLPALAGVDLIVLGHRDRGGLLSLVLGSVGRQVTAHATVPVVVVRDQAGKRGREPGPGRHSPRSAGPASRPTASVRSAHGRTQG